MIENHIEKLMIIAYEPILIGKKQQLENELVSKYFGTAWLNNDEEWPCLDDSGKIPSICVLQLNISTLPEEYKVKLGGEGLLQFFFQYENGSWSEDSLVRKITDFSNGRFVEQPIESGVGQYTEKTIIDWKPSKDYPHFEEFSDFGENKKIQSILKKHDVDEITELLEEKYQCIQGDKLGGWPFYTQGIENFGDFIFQIDAGCFFDGKKFPANAEGLFASDGTGHIFINESDDHDGEFVFNWACG